MKTNVQMFWTFLNKKYDIALGVIGDHDNINSRVFT